MAFTSISNFDLEDLAHEWGIVLNGVVAKDHLNGGVKQGGYIINLQDYNDGGGHIGWPCTSKRKTLFILIRLGELHLLMFCGL
jgi:hypothetical protein